MVVKEPSGLPEKVEQAERVPLAVTEGVEWVEGVALALAQAQTLAEGGGEGEAVPGGVREGGAEPPAETVLLRQLDAVAQGGALGVAPAERAGDAEALLEREGVRLPLRDPLQEAVADAQTVGVAATPVGEGAPDDEARAGLPEALPLTDSEGEEVPSAVDEAVVLSVARAGADCTPEALAVWARDHAGVADAGSVPPLVADSVPPPLALKRDEGEKLRWLVAVATPPRAVGDTVALGVPTAEAESGAEALEERERAEDTEESSDAEAAGLALAAGLSVTSSEREGSLVCVWGGDCEGGALEEPPAGDCVAGGVPVPPTAGEPVSRAVADGEPDPDSERAAEAEGAGVHSGVPEPERRGVPEPLPPEEVGVRAGERVALPESEALRERSPLREAWGLCEGAPVALSPLLPLAEGKGVPVALPVAQWRDEALSVHDAELVAKEEPEGGAEGGAVGDAAAPLPLPQSEREAAPLALALGGALAVPLPEAAAEGVGPPEAEAAAVCAAVSVACEEDVAEKRSLGLPAAEAHPDAVKNSAPVALAGAVAVSAGPDPEAEAVGRTVALPLKDPRPLAQAEAGVLTEGDATVEGEPLRDGEGDGGAQRVAVSVAEPVAFLEALRDCKGEAERDAAGDAEWLPRGEEEGAPEAMEGREAVPGGDDEVVMEPLGVSEGNMEGEGGALTEGATDTEAVVEGAPVSVRCALA